MKFMLAVETVDVQVLGAALANLQQQAGALAVKLQAQVVEQEKAAAQAPPDNPPA